MAENRFGMGGSPAVWQHFFQARILGMEAEKQVADVRPRLNAMTLGARQDRIQHGGSWAGCFIAQEEPIPPAHGLVPQRPLTDVVVCALLRHVESSGATPDRRSSSQPEALGAVQEVMNGLKHSKKRLRRESAGRAGCNVQ
jgi:hypothetical protein